jgi:hypothetical protein
LGILCLAAALPLNQALLGQISLATLTTAIVLFIGSVGYALVRAPRPTRSVLGMQLALLALLVTLLVGMVLLAGHVWPALPL